MHRLWADARPNGPSEAALVLLAPMAGITDLPFRRLVSRFGVDWTVSEMVASQEMVEQRPGARERAALGLDTGNTVVQLAGREAHWMAEAARMVEASGARLIDVNMGCPAKKVANGWSGAGLLRDLDHALRLIEAVVAAVSVPVTLKTRLGWDERRATAPELARRAAEAGVRMVTVHGRTRCQFYKGNADWDAIRAAVEAVKVPVVANGDIVDPAAAAEALARSGAAGVMVGRGAQGAPWQPAIIAAALRRWPRPPVPRGAALAELVAEHHEETLRFYGVALGGRVIRKHLGWYADRAGVPAPLRRELVSAGEPARVRALIALAFAEARQHAA